MSRHGRRAVALAGWPAALAGCLAAGPVAGAEAPAPIFVDATAASGLDFVHFNGMTGQFYFPEMTGQGGALFDYDGDGDLDAFLVQGSMLGPGETLEDALVPPVLPGPPRDRLFRNDLVRGGAGALAPRFVDVTAESGLDERGYGMGVATGDFDRDGNVDLYVTNYGPNALLRNRGDGTFEDVTEVSGTGDPLWGTSAAFFDYDGDGWLDLYVVNYVVFDVAANPRCYAPSSRRDYCGPSDFPPQPDRLYRNRGDGTFEDVTLRVLIGYRPGPGLGVTVADFDGDGRLDIYVANDGAPNQLWIQRPNATFTDEGLFSGAALNRMGRAEASMGVDAADFDLDGDEDLFMTHLAGETNTLYVNDGAGLFEDHTVESGLGAASLPYTAFGTGWLDFDNDGWPDLLVLNGAVRILEDQAAAGEVFPLAQPNQLYRNQGGAFVEVTERAGDAFPRLEVSRGAALGDVDNDGDVDVLQFNNNGPARLLLAQAPGENGWLGARLVGPPPLAERQGVRVEVTREKGRPLHLRTRTDGSYCSARDPRLTVGLGPAARVAAVRAVWPGGRTAVCKSPPAGRYLTLVHPADRPPRQSAADHRGGASSPECRGGPCALPGGGEPHPNVSESGVETLNRSGGGTLNRRGGACPRPGGSR